MLVGDRLEKYNVKFKKKFGQNFLKDVNIVNKIIDVANIKSKSLVIEVGPGGAIMTKELAKVADNVLAYEIDLDLKDELFTKLNGFDNVDILFKDFLNSNLCDDVAKYDYENLYFVSNVPYYITTPIIMKLVNSNLKFKKIVMMVQKEVGDRFVSSPGSREYGSISVLLQYYFDVKREFLVSRNEFVPIPNVDSVIVSFTEKRNKYNLKNIEYFEKIVHDSFKYKRKTIKNNLNNYDLEKIEMILNNYGYNLSVRAEALPVSVFVSLANDLFFE